MKIYLASPLFNVQQKARINKVVQTLRSAGHEVYSPMEHEIPNAWNMPNHEWAQAVYEEDVKNLNKADTVVAIYEGMDSDTGTAWEIGYAVALKKKVYVIIEDASKIQSLMVVNGADAVFHSIGEFIDVFKFNDNFHDCNKFPFLFPFYQS